MWRRIPPKSLAFYLFLCCILTAPWYIRTFILTGNPFYSNPEVGLLPANEFHLGILEGYKESVGLKSYMTWKVVLPLATRLSMALGISFFSGLVSCVMKFRRLGFFLIFTVLMIILWIYSIWIPGGILHSMRILSPIIVINSVCGAYILFLFAGFHGRAYQIIISILFML